ncbi:hypothetical protein TAL182_CH01416 [Rhizobium sp. TAL182]|nr:hypothetical protein TAL182_CH01416 [Rhizobium sp. TAL182]
MIRARLIPGLTVYCCAAPHHPAYSGIPSRQQMRLRKFPPLQPCRRPFISLPMEGEVPAFGVARRHSSG